MALQNEGRFKTVSPPTNEPGMWEAQVRTDEPPASLLEFNHRHTRMVGVINSPLWDRAQWQGVGFTFWPDGVPGMELIFANADAAAKILRGWHRRVADMEADQVLRLAILTDIDRDHRAYYRLGIAPATVGEPDDAAKTLMIASRSKTMMPQETKNLDVFMAAFARHGCFRLGVGTAPDGPHMPFVHIKLAPIELTKVEIKAAWQIEAGEMMFGMMLSGADTPFIPDDVSAPDELPVMQMIGARKQRRGRG